MIKKIFKISLVFSLLFLMQQAKADVLTIGSNTYPSITSIGLEAENYYTVIFLDPASTEASVTSVILYIPKEIFANGTYDLEYLETGSDTDDEVVVDAVKACEDPGSEDEDPEITLPSTNKIFILGGVTQIQERGNFIVGKGITIANKNFSGTKVTLSGIGSGANSPNIEEVNFSINGKVPFTKIQYKVLISENCEEIVKKSKFSISKKAKNTSFTLDATATIVDSNFGF